MQSIVFYALYPLIIFISILPMRVLYFISSFFVYPLLYKVIGYRKAVVRLNMKSVFPKAEDEDLKILEETFYRFLSDLFVEVFKSFTISGKELKARVTFANLEILDEYYQKNRNCELTAGHLGNYEWAAKALPFYLKHRLLAPYRKLSNKHFDRIFKKSREKFGAVMFPTKVTDAFLSQPQPKPYFLGLANDQSAPPTKSYWTRFLNNDTSFFMGTEKMAQKFDLAVFYGEMIVEGRGKYKVTLHKITDKPTDEKEGFIMEEHARLLEENILKNPAYWLWTHKRWKHKMPEGQVYGFS